MIKIMLSFVSTSKKLRESLISPPPQKKKIWGHKHAKFDTILDNFKLWLADISGMDEDS